jgi:hypothetical protein
MNRHPIELLEPLFHWLDWLIAEHGHHIYIVMVWASPFLIAWILSGGFWRRRPRRSASWVPTASPPSQPVPPPLPPIIEASRPSPPLPTTTSSHSLRERNRDRIPGRGRRKPLSRPRPWPPALYQVCRPALRAPWLMNRSTFVLIPAGSARLK